MKTYRISRDVPPRVGDWGIPAGLSQAAKSAVRRVERESVYLDRIETRTRQRAAETYVGGMLMLLAIALLIVEFWIICGPKDGAP